MKTNNVISEEEKLPKIDTETFKSSLISFHLQQYRKTSQQ